MNAQSIEIVDSSEKLFQKQPNLFKKENVKRTGLALSCPLPIN